jgi:hypothetical protein
MTAILIVNITSACISTVATTSRQTWSFARDKGVPFSSFVSYVNFVLYHAPNSADIPPTGQAGLEHPTQRRFDNFHYHLSSVIDQYRFHGSFQCHWISCRIRIISDLYNILYLPHLQTPSRRTASTTSLEPRALRDFRQHWCRAISVDSLGLHIFPRVHTCHADYYELECGNLLRNNDLCGCLLCNLWKEDLYFSC